MLKKERQRRRRCGGLWWWWCGRRVAAAGLLSLSQMAFLLPNPGEGVSGVVLGGNNSSYCLSEVPPDLDSFAVCATVSPSLPTLPQGHHRRQEEEQQDDPDAVIFTLKLGGTLLRASVTASWTVRAEYLGRNYTFDDVLIPGIWRTLCLTYLPERGSVSRGSSSTILFYPITAYIRERESEVQEATVAEDSDTPEDVPPGFCLGSSSDGRVSFAGTILAVSLAPLNAPEPEASEFEGIDCSRLVPLDDVLKLDSFWNASGEVDLIEYDDKELCDDIYTQVALKFVGGHEDMLKKCHLLGGRFPSEGEIRTEIVRLPTRLSESCVTKDEFLSWLGVSRKTEEGLWSKCSVLLKEGEVGERHCITELECSVCLVPRALRFTLYGHIHNMDRSYTLQSSLDGKMYMRGEGASEIHGLDESWILQSNLHAQKMRLDDSPLPVGRQRWKASDKEEEELTLTPCGAAQFSCDDGTCVPRRQKCDGIEQCPDHSDETYCKLMVRANGYNKYISPVKSKSSNQANGVKSDNYLIFSVGVHSIGPINTLDGVATIEMSFVFQWFEDRMKYWELTEQPNIMDCDDIWVPELTVMAGRTEGMGYDLDVYHASCYVEKLLGLSQHWDMEDPNMGRYFNGWEQPLKYEMKFRMKIPCNFKLHRYPFGSQVCPGTFYVLNGGEPSMVFQTTAASRVVNYSGNHDLLEYKLLDITYEYDAEQIVVMLHLKSLYDYHVLNSFVPSAIVFLISLTTLFFPVDDFNERIMVSLTVLVVLAALFTQASGASVKTPYFKLLDIWYTALVALCFVVVVVNAIVHAILRRRKDSINVVMPKDRVSLPHDDERNLSIALKFNCFARVVMFTIFFGLVFAYALLGADVL
ncbi:uncharacterized protein [Panulirus ornatus]|uniref:uncharacterized protein n=1 Tax=Panulirus ornatus TaxID=150431 RepID=UPI003A86744A